MELGWSIGKCDCHGWGQGGRGEAGLRGWAGWGGVNMVGKLPRGCGERQPGLWSVVSGLPSRKEKWPDPLAVPPLSLPHITSLGLRSLTCSAPSLPARGLQTGDCSVLPSQQGGPETAPARKSGGLGIRWVCSSALAWGSVCESGMEGVVPCRS